jgi:hypothetical protein
MLKLLLLFGYLFIAWRFWKGFGQTNFTDRRLVLSLLWPVLLIASGSYRENFQRALRG